MKHILRTGFLVLVLLSLFALIQPSASLAGQDERVIIEFAPGSGAAVHAELARAGGQIHYRFDRINAVAVTLPSTAVEALRRNPNVVSIEADARRYPASVNADQVVPWGIDAVQARDVWDANLDDVVDDGAPTGAGITVCIIDSGLYTGHEDIDELKVLGGTPEGWDTDLCGHGTHVAGTIAARNNDLGVIGVTPGTVSLYIVKVFGDDCLWAYSSTLVHASEECYEAGADIISMSLSGTQPMKAEQRQFDALYQAGVLSIAAASNEGAADGVDPYHYPASYDSVVSVAAIDEDLVVAGFSQNNDQVELAAPGVSVESTVPYVAKAELTVGGVTYVGNLIEFADLGTVSGPLVDGGLCDAAGAWDGEIVLCERGDISFYDKVMNVRKGDGLAAVIYNNEPGNFFGTLGDLRGARDTPAISLSQEDGQSLVPDQLDVDGTLVADVTWPASSYEHWDGTSMATPHVSGVAALLWSANPGLSNEAIRAAMTSTAYDLGDSGRDVEYGYGLVQVYDAWQALPEGGAISLTAVGYRERGSQVVDLAWAGATTRVVHILRDGTKVATIDASSGEYTDFIGLKGIGIYMYQVCELGNGVCSNEVTISF